MATQQVNVYEAKAQLSKLMDLAERGENVVIARAGTPIVRLVKWEAEGERTPGLWAGQVRMSDDFDELSSQDERDWYGR